MIPFTVSGERFESGIRLFDQYGQRSSGDGNGLLATDGDKELIWYSEGAVKVLRRISCENVPIDAVICDFAVVPGSENRRGSAIAILLTSEILQLHLFNGETFSIHLPFPMSKMYTSSEGLLLQRKLPPKEIVPDTSTSMNSNHFPYTDDSNRDDGFDVKLWLDGADGADEGNEANDGDQMQFDAPSVMQSPSFSWGGEKRNILSPGQSVAESLEKYIHTAVGSSPSPCFFSLAHPTAPVRPMKILFNGVSDCLTDNSRHHYHASDSQDEKDENADGNSYYGQDKFSTDLNSTPHAVGKDNRENRNNRDNNNNGVSQNGSDRKNNKSRYNINTNMDPNYDDQQTNYGDKETNYSQNQILGDTAEHILLAVEGNIMCTLQRRTSCIVLWHVGQVTSNSLQDGDDESLYSHNNHNNRNNHNTNINNMTNMTNNTNISNLSTASQATSTTIANTSVLESRLNNLNNPQRDSPSSFLSMSASGVSRHSQSTGSR